MSGYTTENKFVIAEKGARRFICFSSGKKAHPDEPRIIYDGYDHAIFMRRPEERIILDYIHPEVRAQLRKAKRVVMVETILENIKESYYADMQMVEKYRLIGAKSVWRLGKKLFLMISKLKKGLAFFSKYILLQFCLNGPIV